MPDFRPHPEELFRDANSRLNQVQVNIPKRDKFLGIPGIPIHSHSKASLNRQIDVANDSATHARANAEIALKHQCPPDNWVGDLRVQDNSFHVASKHVRDEVDSRPNLPVESFIHGMDKAAKIVASPVIKRLLGKSE
jgi:hypothetical protein